MALLTLEEAAARVGAPRTTIEEWIRSGLLDVQVCTRPASIPVGAQGTIQMEKYVDDDELFELSESMGWFELSTENWDSSEDT